MIVVDDLLSWGWKYGKSCHMFDTNCNLAKLDRFAIKLRLKRSWFQNHDLLLHYDLTESKRIKAIRMGAVEVPRSTVGKCMKERRKVLNQSSYR